MEEGSRKFKVVYGILRWFSYIIGVATYLVGVLTLGFYRPTWLMKFGVFTLDVLYGKESTGFERKKK